MFDTFRMKRQADHTEPHWHTGYMTERGDPVRAKCTKERTMEKEGLQKGIHTWRTGASTSAGALLSHRKIKGERDIVGGG